MIPNIVIVKWPKGYVAHIRYGDAQKDRDISHPSKFVLEQKIDQIVEENK